MEHLPVVAMTQICALQASYMLWNSKLNVNPFSAELMKRYRYRAELNLPFAQFSRLIFSESRNVEEIFRTRQDNKRFSGE